MCYNRDRKSIGLQHAHFVVTKPTRKVRYRAGNDKVQNLHLLQRLQTETIYMGNTVGIESNRETPSPSLGCVPSTPVALLSSNLCSSVSWLKLCRDSRSHFIPWLLSVMWVMWPSPSQCQLGISRHALACSLSLANAFSVASHPPCEQHAVLISLRTCAETHRHVEGKFAVHDACMQVLTGKATQHTFKAPYLCISI